VFLEESGIDNFIKCKILVVPLEDPPEHRPEYREDPVIVVS
jgi:hypothetical protein